MVRKRNLQKKKSLVIAAGRLTPQPGQSGQRGEGVAIVLTGPAIDAWKKGGEQWKSKPPLLPVEEAPQSYMCYLEPLTAM